MKEEIKVIYFRESYLQSFFADLTTYGVILGSCWFNFALIGGSKFVYALLLIMFMLMMYSKAKNKSKIFYTIKDAQNYINNQ